MNSWANFCQRLAFNKFKREEFRRPISDDVRPDNFKVLRQLGRGSYGTVKLVKHKKKNKEYAPLKVTKRYRKRFSDEQLN